MVKKRCLGARPVTNSNSNSRKGSKQQEQRDQKRGKSEFIMTKANMKNARRKTLKERRKPQSISIMIYVNK